MTPNTPSQTKAEIEDYYHYQRTCLVCGNTWWGLHCPHDDYQNPCPDCQTEPKPITCLSEHKCVLVAPLAIVQAAELRGRISELENMPNHTAVNLHVRDRLDELTKQAQVSL